MNFYTALGPEICSSPLGQTRPTTLYIFEHLSLHIHFPAFKPSYTFSSISAFIYIARAFKPSCTPEAFPSFDSNNLGHQWFLLTPAVSKLACLKTVFEPVCRKWNKFGAMENNTRTVIHFRLIIKKIKYICPNYKIYFPKLQNVFVQIQKYIYTVVH